MKKILKKIGFTICLVFTIVLTVKPQEVCAGWESNDVGVWWEEDDGSYPTNEWKKINGSWYYFGPCGYRTTGWRKIEQFWYYFDQNGKLATGWRKISGEWYYLTIGDGVEHPHGSWIDNNACEEGTIKGIDVSRWQGNIDWQKVKNDGVEFAFIRIGAYDYSIDSKFETNIKSANEVGVPVGVYYYCTARTPEAARSQAQFVIYNLQGYQVSYPIVIDLEDSSMEDLSKEEIGYIAKAFCDEVRAAGYIPMLYCNENWAKNYIDMSLLSDVELWIAAYCNVYNTNIERDIWQCCSTGRVDGINGDVDIDFGYTDYSKLYTPRTYVADSYFLPDGYIEMGEEGIAYYFFNGGKASNEWKYLDGYWYWLDADGKAATGWKMIDSRWYWFDGKGRAVSGWKQIDGNWYYFGKSCAMATGWLEIDGYWYYLGKDGSMRSCTYIDGYYVDSAGRYVPNPRGWIRGSAGWWYVDADGRRNSNEWAFIGNDWYWFDQNGYAAIGWRFIGNKWYWFESDCSMVVGWKKINNKWYYFNSSGQMVADQYVGNYYVNQYGEWVE